MQIFPEEIDMQAKETTTTNYMIDLHGLSRTEAKEVVHFWLLNCVRNEVAKIRFVTGRGNHANRSGERGILYKSRAKHRSQIASKFQAFNDLANCVA